MLEHDGPCLSVENLVTGYGKKQILDGVSLTAGKGEIVAVIGHNGSGKSTLLKAAFGLLPIWRGRILFWGKEIQPLNQRDLLCRGVGYVPQGNRVFTRLTVRENLELSIIILKDHKRLRHRIEQVLTLFPPLEPRLQLRASSLSGGEKQMLALASAFILSPRVILLDEPSLGLSPSLVSEALQRIECACRDLGTAVLIVEQKVREVLKIAQRVYVLRSGRVSFVGSASELRTDEVKLRSVYL